MDSIFHLSLPLLLQKFTFSIGIDKNIWQLDLRNVLLKMKIFTETPEYVTSVEFYINQEINGNPDELNVN